MAKQRTCPAHARKVYVTVHPGSGLRCRWRVDGGEYYDYPDKFVQGREQLHAVLDQALDDIERNIAHYQEG